MATTPSPDSKPATTTTTIDSDRLKAFGLTIIDQMQTANFTPMECMLVVQCLRSALLSMIVNRLGIPDAERLAAILTDADEVPRGMIITDDGAGEPTRNEEYLSTLLGWCVSLLGGKVTLPPLAQVRDFMDHNDLRVQRGDNGTGIIELIPCTHGHAPSNLPN